MTAIAPQVDKPILIRFSNVVGENNRKDLVAEIFKTRAEEKLAGNVAVEVNRTAREQAKCAGHKVAKAEGIEIFMPSAGELA